MIESSGSGGQRPATPVPAPKLRLRRIAVAAATLGAALTALGQVKVGPEIQLSNAPITRLGLGGVSIARASNGRSLAVWSDDRTGDHDVYGSFLSPTGARLTPLGGFRIVGSPGTNEGDPRVAACGNTFLVVWGNGFNDDNITDVFATRVSSAGVVLNSTPIVISNQSGVQHNYRKHASDGIATFLIPFRTKADSDYGGISTMRVSASTGAVLDPPGGVVLALGSSAQGLKKNPSASFGAGQFFVTWDDERELCQYPNENGCIDIFGAFVDPATGVAIGPSFPTTRAFSCQEGSRSDFDGTNFFVTHNDERLTNCSTADVTGERVAPDGTVLDPVDPAGMYGGLEIAGDPAGFPGSVQGAATVLAEHCARLVTYADFAAPPSQVALRMKRLDGDGRHEYGMTWALPGLLIAQGSPSPGASARIEACVIGPHAYLLGYALNTIPAVRTARFTIPMLRNIVVGGPVPLDSPMGVAVDAMGNIYVANKNKHRIEVFSGSGQFVKGFGSLGGGDGQFRKPWGVAVDGTGRICVADTDNNRVQVFDGNGQFLFKFGASGSATGKFRSPLGIAADTAGKIYVADTSNNRVQVFSSTGQFLRAFGSLGTGNGQFDRARAVTVDPAGQIYVTDAGNGRVQVFSSTGGFVRKFPCGNPHGVAVDHDGRLYVAHGGRIGVYSGVGQLYFSCGMLGTMPGGFRDTHEIALDAGGNIFATDAVNNRVQVFGCIP